MAAATSILEEWFSATILDTNSGEVTFSVTQYEGGPIEEEGLVKLDIWRPL